MPKRTSNYSYRKSREIIVGDLVYHILYGKEWVGVLLGFEEEDNGISCPRELALVHLQPNTEYQDYFSKTLTKYRLGPHLGYVSTHWLFKIEISK